MCGPRYVPNTRQMFFLSVEEIQGSDLEASTPHHTEAYRHTGFLGPALGQTYRISRIQELGQA
ncbi:hypothetical protein HanRHA438_Chr15g0684571 [Helianthus annuus]|nr:hypothetical protein HanIR_Chr15g0730511 [Helianthus annuus]KAJ0842808.1 hypothetical protein HanRHA438_Chr15g0684571 [Helianthus annuus]